MQSYPCTRPYIRFLFVRPAVCLHLPSDSTSQWTLLVLAMIFPLPGNLRTLTGWKRAPPGAHVKEVAVFVWRPLPTTIITILHKKLWFVDSINSSEPITFYCHFVRDNSDQLPHIFRSPLSTHHHDEAHDK